uniref:Aftiphilin clathrin-binding box domain-containing protein n=1 Tax=Sus scrofa TaxID=9823 RepID=A0A4X1TZB6_PIG
MRLCGPGGTNMQGQRELGGAPGQMPPLRRFPSDLTEQAGGVSLCPLSKDSDASEAPGKQSGGAADLLAQAASSPRVSGHHEGLSTCTLSGPEPGEHPGAWGEFEGFQESSARSEQFSQSFELPERPTEPQLPRTASAQRERGSPQPRQGGPAWTEATAIAPAEPILSYENIFRSAFQEVPAQQATEDVSALDHFLETSDEEKPGLEPLHKLCSESRKVWGALQSAACTSTSRCLWGASRCRESLLLVLGVDAAQGHAQGQPDLAEPAEPGAHGFCLRRCRALIQTKLAGTLGGRQGGLVTYSLFLKTPFWGAGQHMRIPRKKILTPCNLEMTLCKSDVC